MKKLHNIFLLTLSIALKAGADELLQLTYNLYQSIIRSAPTQRVLFFINWSYQTQSFLLTRQFQWQYNRQPNDSNTQTVFKWYMIYHLQVMMMLRCITSQHSHLCFSRRQNCFGKIGKVLVRVNIFSLLAPVYEFARIHKFHFYFLFYTCTLCALLCTSWWVSCCRLHICLIRPPADCSSASLVPLQSFCTTWQVSRGHCSKQV